METDLNAVSYQQWHARHSVLSDRILTVQLCRLGGSTIHIEPSFTVIFRDVQYLEVFDEVRTGDAFFSGRSSGVLAVHEESELLNRRATQELNSARAYTHYSLLTSDEVFNVLSGFEPQLIRNDG